MSLIFVVEVFCFRAYPYVEWDFYWHKDKEMIDNGLQVRVRPCDRVQAQKIHVLFMEDNFIRVFSHAEDPRCEKMAQNPKGDLLEISRLGNRPLYALHIAHVYLEGVGILRKETIVPFFYPILESNQVLYFKICPRKLLFWEQFCMIRFGYREKFGHEYYQDVSFCISGESNGYYVDSNLSFLEGQEPTLWRL